MKNVAAMQNTECELHLVRHRVSFCKLAYSARTVPPSLHSGALQEFSTSIKAALGELVATALPEKAWDQAKLSIKGGGLGLRGVDEHASAAFLASVSASNGMCKAIDENFDPADEEGHLLLQETRRDFQRRVLPQAVADVETQAHRQRHLSGLVDAKVREDLRQETQTDQLHQAHLSLEEMHGAGAWLTAPPVDED